jgi:hypothetical protein
VRIEVTPDRTAITVGDPIVVTVRVLYPEGTRLVGFAPERALGSLVLLGQEAEPPRPLPEGGIAERRTLRVTAYAPGGAEIPAIEVSYADAAGREGKAASRAVPISVASVLAPDDTTPADIKGPAEMPEPVRWPWVLAALLLLGAGAAWWWRRRARRPAAIPATPATPPRPPHEIAYGELERLLASGLLEAGKVKEFYIELAEILKRYLEGRYGVDTFERTSAEILEALRVARVALRDLTATGEFFAACDLVKFARHRPEPEETRATVERAYRLVDQTRPPAPPRAAPAGPGAAVAAAGARPGASS